jgi:class 3 adenylate cyclase
MTCLIAIPGVLQVVAGAGLVLALSLGLGALYALGGPLVPPLPPILALTVGIGLALFELARQERRDRIVLMDLFSEHLSRPVAAAIWRQRATFLTGGRPRPQRLTATVLFSDIDSFTPACEQLDPERLMAWVQTYLNTMTGIIADHGGIVLRFMGDGILAAFGVPIARDDDRAIAADAVQSARCALHMEAALDGLNRGWRDQGLPPVSIRIGIQTGPLVAGSLGNDRHMEYSIMGDTVNVAARLEAFARTAPNAPGRMCRILVGEETWLLLDGQFEGEPLGPLALKGKLQSVKSYRVLAERDAPNACALAPAGRGVAATPRGRGA